MTKLTVNYFDEAVDDGSIGHCLGVGLLSQAANAQVPASRGGGQVYAVGTAVLVGSLAGEGVVDHFHPGTACSLQVDGVGYGMSLDAFRAVCLGQAIDAKRQTHGG